MSFMKRHLILQATCAFRFMCKQHIANNAYYISRDVGVKKV